MKVENPFVTHRERLLELMRLHRCSLQYTAADFVLVLIYPEHSDINFYQMLENSTKEDVDLVCELIQWVKNHTIDNETKAVGRELLIAMTQDVQELSSVEALFRHYRSMNIEIGETSKSAVPQVKRLMEQGASLQAFPRPGEDHYGVFGHHIVVNGRRLKERFAVNRNHGNGKLSFGNKYSRKD